MNSLKNLNAIPMIDKTKPLDRFLMFLPGFLAYLTLTFPLTLGIVNPAVAAFLLTFVTIYFVFQALSKGLFGLIIGYRKYKKETSIDWYKKIQELDYDNLPNKDTLPESFDKLKHFILIPTVKEDYSILRDTFKSIMDSNYPTEQLLVVIGIEEVGKNIVEGAIEKFKNEFKDEVPKIISYIHPKGIEGEITGVASPNRTWAAKHAVDYLRNNNEKIEDYIFSTYDSDWIVHKEYFSRITYQYLIDPKRFNKYFQSHVHIYNRNIYDVPFTCRIEACRVTAGILSEETYPEIYQETFSAYSAALQTVVDANYWDVTLIDDTMFYWRAFNARRGDFEEVKHYIPLYGYATGGKDFVSDTKSLYKQLVRWGWGSTATVVAIKSILSKQNNQISISKKLIWLAAKIERHTLIRSTAFLLTFGFEMLTLVNVNFNNSSISYGLPQALSILLTIAFVLFLPYTYIKNKLYGGIPKTLPLYKKIFLLCEGPLVILNMLTSSFLPYIYAETRMMFGVLPKKTYYTEKI